MQSKSFSWTISQLHETILTLLALLWGVLLVLPGNTFAAPSGIATLFLFAQDWVWGVLLIAVSLPFLFVNKYRHLTVRRLVHAFYWVFWSGLSFLAYVRVAANGIQALDLILPSLLITFALFHAVFYIGSWRRP